MKLIDLLLLIAGFSLVAAGWLVTPPLGCLALSIAAGGSWYLLGEDSE